MAQRYFKVSFDSKKTKHPSGQITEFIYSEGRHKKEAFELATELLHEKFPDYTEFFKLPSVAVEYASLEEYREALPVVSDSFDPDADNSFNHDDHAAFNTNEDLGITDNDLRAYVALVTLYGLADEYTDKMIADAECFSESPDNGTPEERKAFCDLYEAMLLFMPPIFKNIVEDKLLKLISYVDSKLGKLTDKHLYDFTIDFITHELKLEFQQEMNVYEKQPLKNNGLQENKPVEKAPIEEKTAPVEVVTDTPQDSPKIEIAPIKISPVKVDTFNADLAELNARIDALPVGGSFFIDGLSNRLYHASNAYSKSSLDIVNRDPALIEWSKNAPKTDNEDSLIFGNAFHTIVLEPHLFNEQFLIMPDLNLRTNAGKAEKIELEAEAKRNEKSILSKEQNEQLKLMKGSVFAHPTAKKLFSDGVAERSIFFRYSKSLVVRIRPDWLTETHGKTFMIDLKSTADASKFEKSIDDFRYHVQDAFYSYVFERATGTTPIFAFCATGKAVEMGKYPTRLVLLDDHDKEAGYHAFKNNLDTIENCLESGVWGGFETVQRPAWARRNDQF